MNNNMGFEAMSVLEEESQNVSSNFLCCFCFRNWCVYNFSCYYFCTSEYQIASNIALTAHGEVFEELFSITYLQSAISINYFLISCYLELVALFPYIKFCQRRPLGVLHNKNKNFIIPIGILLESAYLLD